MAAPSRLVNFRSSPDVPWRAGAELDGRVVDLLALLDRNEPLTVDSLVEQGPGAVRDVLASAAVRRGSAATMPELAARAMGSMAMASPFVSSAVRS